MATTVRVTETFDMKTTTNKLGIIGIHTPTGEQIRRMYPGLVKGHRFMRVLSCDIVGACASVLPADPLQIGVASGDIAPEDMFNPILMKAVTNESFDMVVSRIYNSQDVSNLGSVNKSEVLTGNSAFNVYYSLLASKGWKKAMPQSGFAMRGLVPLAHTLVSTFGNIRQPGNKMVWGPDPADPGQGVVDTPVADFTAIRSVKADFSGVDEVDSAITFRGKPVRMPRFSCHMYGAEDYFTIPNLNIMKTFVACLVMPPARLHEFYYRMRVTWTIRFEEVAPATEFMLESPMSTTSRYCYAKDYSYVGAKSELDNECASIDSEGVSVEKVMES